jgi:hypothetical protein
MKSLLRSVFVVLLFVLLMLSLNTTCKEVVSEIVESDMSGTVVKKYRQTNKKLETVIIRTKTQSIKLAYIEFRDLYDFVEVGDSIAKPPKSDLVIIYKTSGDTLRYFFSCN